MDIFEKNAWNDAWNKVLNRLGIRKVPGGTVNYLGNVLSTIETDLAKAGATTAAMTLYVDAATGADTNSGLVGFPLKTIQAAIDRVPQTIKHNVTINVGAGTYVEQINFSPNVVNAMFKLVGTMQDYTPGTGIASGTLGVCSSWSFPVVGAGWTPSALKGKFVQITSGLFNGVIFPVADNAAATIDIPYSGASLNNVTFKFVQHATTINNSSSNHTLKISGQNDPWIGGSVQISNMNIVSSGFTTGSIYLVGPYIQFNSCILNSQLYTFYATGLNGALSLYECYMVSSLGYGIAIDGHYTLKSYSCVFDGVSIELGGGVYNSSKDIMQAAPVDAIRLSYSTGARIYVWETLIRGAVGNAINLYGPCTSNYINVASKSNISGNTGFGIKVPVGIGAFTNIQIGSTVTMNTNALGDLTLDGTTAISIADLRADPDKTVVDLIRLNRIAAD